MLRNRVLLDFVVAPLPVLGPLLLMHVLILLTASPDSAAIVGSMLELSLSSYGVTLLIGIPIHLILRQQKRNGLAAYLAATVLALILTGAAVAAGEILFTPSLEQNPFGLTMWGRSGVIAMLIFGLMASVSAALFWNVAVKPKHS